MPEMKSQHKAAFDYIGNYERAIKEVVRECGSREAANEMLEELHQHYEKTDAALKNAKKTMWKDPEALAKQKAVILSNARVEVAEIIEKHVPHSGEQVRDLILGTSLAIAAIMIPATYAFSTLTAAATILSVGGSYYLSFRLLKNWKATSSKGQVAEAAGRASPKSIAALPKIVKLQKKN
ncbi:Uncharacterised protein [uncultured archaeon]|nr:Uncharacterised protein [uncultured archaeon]